MQIALVVPNDLGPIYAETRMDRFPVEPCNTVSNLGFLLVVVLTLRRMRGRRWNRLPVTGLALLIIATGFVGGSLYHATRALDLWRLLDVMPILLAVLLASVYFWYAVLGGLWRVLLVLLPVILGYRWLLASPAAESLDGIAHGYIFLALLVLLPAILHCALRRGVHARLLAGAGLCFLLAFACRELDETAALRLLPMGTHFLWHLLGAGATGFAVAYLLEVECERLPEYDDA
jgi:hemolysin III